ncbi:hypothetical protein [Draconibacterium orientale]|uniref:hypothetical protein n=1 Tax=Draconibacterium orientale TaxID=1168034 RepID=UPI002A0A151F|nr:hypothetical protein [Draconibacterium orientale]
MENHEFELAEVYNQVQMLFGEDYNFRYNVTNWDIEYQRVGEDSWQRADDNFFNSIKGVITEEFGDVYSPEFIRAMLIAGTHQDAYNESGLTNQEWMAESLLNWIRYRNMGIYDFRFNVSTKKIEVFERGIGIWKEMLHDHFATIADSVCCYEFKYYWGDIKECLKNAPSIRYH